ncbi:MAG: polysaccharide deacetylase family protein [Alphaproteobacteria bacterium]|jgi:peptidoglycan/xylan/chitin deacetylase (PgdA/CDA1 family)|nr:polysaccharide deacetylase family protein [Alphaproteobacteria bacterium]
MLFKALSFVATAVAAVALILAFVMLPPSQIEPANAYFQPGNIYRSGLVGTKTLALTFDDGPSAFTDDILDSLARHQARATFFVVGTRVRHHPAAMERMMREGHVIANHSFSHANLGQYVETPHRLIVQVGNTNAAIAPYVRPGQGLYFRAPYGVWRRAHARILNEDPVLKHYVGPIYWDVGGSISYDDNGTLRAAADWDCWSHDLSADECARGYLREIRRKQGGVVLMHDIRERSLWMIEKLLPQLVAEGYTFVTLDEVREYDQYKAPVTPDDVPVAEYEGVMPYGATAR